MNRSPILMAGAGMGSRSARHTLIAVTGLVFCTLSPLITALTFLNGAVCRFLYSYLFVPRSRPSFGTYFGWRRIDRYGISV